MTVVDRLTVIPVGRGDHVISLRVYRADDLAVTRELAALRTKVAEQALTIAALERNGVDGAADLARRPRWYVLHRPAWRCERLGAALATVGTWAGMVRRRLRGRPRPTPVIDAIWE